MLNGAHSMLAYVGFHCGYKYVRDVMTDSRLVKLIERHMQVALTTLEPVEGIDFKVYAADLIERFRNTAIAHETFQIAMDGSEKLPLRIFSVIQIQIIPRVFAAICLLNGSLVKTYFKIYT